MVLIENAGGHVYNAPVVAFDKDAEALNLFCNGDADHSVVHDKVVSICPEEQTVTLTLTPGLSFARPNLYLSTEASDPLAATLEGGTLAPGLNDITVGRDDSFTSAVERIFVFTNGPTGTDNPHRQGLNSAISDGRSPLNVLGGIPTIATDYSPLWDMNLGRVDAKKPSTQVTAVGLSRSSRFWASSNRAGVTGPGGEPYGSVGIIVNCPIVFRFL